MHVLNSRINMAAENMKVGRNHLEGMLLNSTNHKHKECTQHLHLLSGNGIKEHHFTELESLYNSV